MKLFRNNIIYVQIKDIEFLKSRNILLPESINKKVLAEQDNSNYIEFKLEEEIDFFKKQYYIIDYDEFSLLSLEEIEEIAHKVGSKVADIINKFNTMSLKVRKDNIFMLDNFFKLKYMHEAISTIWSEKYNNALLPVPKDNNQSVIKKEIIK